MKLQKLFEYLTLGELKQLSIGGYEEFKAIQVADYPEVVNHVNLGLMNLYTRFPLLEKELVIRTKAMKQLYLLSSLYDEYSGNAEWYIQGKFDDDIVRVNAAYVGNTELAINDENSPFSIYLPSYNSVQIPFSTGEEEVSIIYRAKPEEVTLDLECEIPIPDVLTEALLVYVEYRIRKSMGGESSIALSNQALQMYEMMCAEVERKNLLNNADNSTCIRARERGWV
ncbi:MAG: hypothetical protein ACRC9H_02910 [Aeromonas veronii]